MRRKVGGGESSGSSPSTSRFICELCESAFISPAHLKRHLKAHAKLLEHSCLVCGQRFSQASHLKRHSLTKHATPETVVMVKRFCCPRAKCAAKFLSGWELRRHERKAHRLPKPIVKATGRFHNRFHCELCPSQSATATFRRKADLLSHQNARHWKRHRFQCRLCISAKFLQQVQFDRHYQKYHVAPIKTSLRCELCCDEQLAEEMFSSPDELAHHFQIVHGVSKVFPCRYCSRVFFESADRTNHNRAVHFILLGSSLFNKESSSSQGSPEDSIEEENFSGRGNPSQSLSSSSTSFLSSADAGRTSACGREGNETAEETNLRRIRLLINIVNDEYADRQVLKIGDSVPPSLLSVSPSFGSLELKLSEPSRLGQTLCLDLMVRQTANRSIDTTNFGAKGCWVSPTILSQSSIPTTLLMASAGASVVGPDVPLGSPLSPDESGSEDEEETGEGKLARLGRRSKPYGCEMCAAAFGSKMELEEHLNSHTGHKPFECDICHARFNRRSTLWNHKRIHSDTKPFTCPICAMTFKWKNSLKCHKEMHLRKNETVATDGGTLVEDLLAVPPSKRGRKAVGTPLATAKASKKRKSQAAPTTPQQGDDSSDLSSGGANDHPTTTTSPSLAVQPSILQAVLMQSSPKTTPPAAAQLPRGYNSVISTVGSSPQLPQVHQYRFHQGNNNDYKTFPPVSRSTTSLQRTPAQLQLPLYHQGYFSQSADEQIQLQLGGIRQSSVGHPVGTDYLPNVDFMGGGGSHHHQQERMGGGQLHSSPVVLQSSHSGYNHLSSAPAGHFAHQQPLLTTSTTSTADSAAFTVGLDGGFVVKELHYSEW